MRRAGLLLLIAALGWAALLDGAVALWALLPAAVASAAAAVAVGWTSTPYQPRREASVLFWLVIGLTAYTAVQAVPLPAGVVRLLSPHSADIWARALHPLARPGPAWHPLSLDPLATRVQILRGATYGAVFFASALLARGRSERRFLERALVVLSVVVAAATIVHVTVDARRLWGFYAPRTAVGLVAPFFNKNQLAGYLNIGLLIAFASAVAREPLIPRSLAIVVTVGLAGMLVFLGSRGALVAATAGASVVGWTTWRGYRLRRRVYLDLIVPILTMVGGLSAIVLTASDHSAHALWNRDFSKLWLVRASLFAMAPKYVLTGVGRGAFESTFPEFSGAVGWVVFTHPENVIAQWAVEWGTPVAIVAFAACAFALRPRVAMSRTYPAIACLAVIVATFLQNLVDFSSEFPGIVMALCVCAGVVTAGAAGPVVQPGRVVSRWTVVPRTTAVVLLALVATGIAATIPAMGHDLLADQRAVARAGVGSGDDASDLVSAILRHPAEPYFAYVGAVRAASTPDDPRVLPWVGRALERAPTYGPAHLVLARWLLHRAPAQARLEYRFCQEQGGAFVGDAELIAAVRSYNDAIEISPSGEQGVGVLQVLSKALGQSRPATAERIDEEILRRRSGDTAVLQRMAASAWLDVEQDEPWCPKCEDDASSLALRLETVAPTTCEPYVIRARLLARKGERAQAMSHLKSAIARVSQRGDCVEQLARLATSMGDDEEADDAIRQLAQLPCNGDDCVSHLLVAADLERTRRSPHRELFYLQKAAETAPERDDIIARLASLATELQLPGEARDAYRILWRRHPENDDYRERALRP